MASGGESLGATAGASPSAIPVAPPAAPVRAPRITLLRRSHPGRSGGARPSPGVWQTAESRGSRRRRLRATRPPRRSVPADLFGKCFNCFSPSHTASFCRQRTRCFRCRSQGHRSYKCPLVANGGNTSSCAVGRTSVWRRLGHGGEAARASAWQRLSLAGAARGARSAQGLVWRRIGPARDAASAATLQRSSPAGVAHGASLARGSVWQRVGSGREVYGTTPPQRSSPAGVAGGAGASQNNLEIQARDQGAPEGRSRRRRRPRYRRRSVQGTPDPAPASDTLPAASSSMAPPAEDPAPCIIDWSEQVARAEADLAHAVTVTVIDDEPLAAVEDVAAVIAPRIAVEASSLVLRRASSSSYLLVLPDTTLVDRLVSLQQPMRSSSFSFSLLCKRWNRLAGAHARGLPFLLDIELRGIPAHVWETSTVDLFLSPHAWVQQVHPDTLALSDMSCFRCLAWSTDPSALPSARELWVVEPPVAAIEDPLVNRVLAYHVELKYKVARPAGPAPGPPPSSDSDSADDDSTRQRRRIRSSSPSSGAGPTSGADQVTSCNSGQVGSQLGSVRGQRRAACFPAADAGTKEPLQEQGAPTVACLAVLNETPILEEAATAATVGVVIEGSTSEVVRPGSEETIPSVGSPTLMCFQMNVGGGGCSWNKENVFPGPHLSTEPSSVNLVCATPGPVVTVDSSCGLVEDLPLSSGPEHNLLLASTSGTKNAVGLDGATAWNSPGQTALCSFGSQPADKATDGDPLPTSPSPPWCSPSIPEFKHLVTPPPRRSVSVKPLQVYSRRRLRQHLREHSNLVDAATPVVAMSQDGLPFGGDQPIQPPPPPGLETPSSTGVVVSSVTPQAAGPTGVVVPSSTPLMAGTTHEFAGAERMTLQAAVAAPMLAAQQEYINKLARRAVGLLPVPRSNKRKSKSRPPGEASRQSRRLAGKKVEFGPDDLGRRMKKKAMQTLDILGEQEGIDQQALDDYAKLFGQPLCDSHILALTALFNWSLPDEFGPGGGLELIAD